MHWRFFRRIRVLPNLWLNFSKSSMSMSVGVRGLRATLGHRKTRLTVGLPGTGFSASHVAPNAPPEPRTGDGRRLLDRALRGE